MKVNRYVLTLKHDNGTIILKTSATDKATARAIVMACEHCPENAIQFCETQREYSQRQMSKVK